MPSAKKRHLPSQWYGTYDGGDDDDSHDEDDEDEDDGGDVGDDGDDGDGGARAPARARPAPTASSSVEACTGRSSNSASSTVLANTWLSIGVTAAATATTAAAAAAADDEDAADDIDELVVRFALVFRRLRRLLLLLPSQKRPSARAKDTASAAATQAYTMRGSALL